MKQPEALKIGIGPSNIRDHRLENSDWGCAGKMVVCDDRSAPVGMPVDNVASSVDFW